MVEELEEPAEQQARAAAPANQPKSHSELARETELIIRRLAELSAKSRQLAHQNQLLKRRLEELTQRLEAAYSRSRECGAEAGSRA